MRVADENGQVLASCKLLGFFYTFSQDTKTAVVGDPLKMTWEILDQDSPYEIFIRDLVALDGSTDTELLLIDERGCPTDSSIMGEVYRSEKSNRISLSNFDAFRFPTSEVVQFRAMITPCLPKCEPVVCDVLDYTGQTKSVDSYGRKKRSVMSSYVDLMTRKRRAVKPEEMLVVQSLKIVDRYGKKEAEKKSSKENSGFDFLDEDLLSGAGIVEPECLDKTSMISGAVIFLAAQLVIVILFAMIWRRNQRNSSKGLDLLEGSTAGTSRADSLSYLYESGFARRLQ